MQGVLFGNLHTYDDYSLMMSAPPVVSPPKPREHWVEIPGMDGALDLSKVQTGEMQYELRTIGLNFVYIGARENWPTVYSRIMNDLNGKHMHITLDFDPNYYYDGIVRVESYDPDQSYFALSVLCTVQPYKYAPNGSKGGF